MPLPPIEAERWRMVEQKLSEFSVDIQRLWRQVQQIPRGGPASDGTLTPEQLELLTGAGSGGGGDVVKVYSLCVRGHADGGTVSVTIVGGSTYTIDWNASESSILTTLSAADAGVQVQGGNLKYNVIKIRFSTDATILYVSNDSLTRAEYGVAPKPECSACFEPARYW